MEYLPAEEQLEFLGDRGKIKSVFSPIALASWLANLVAKANHKLLMGFFGKGHKDLLLLLRHRESQIIAEEDAFLPGKKKKFFKLLHSVHFILA